MQAVKDVELVSYTFLVTLELHAMLNEWIFSWSLLHFISSLSGDLVRKKS